MPLDLSVPCIDQAYYNGLPVCAMCERVNRYEWKVPEEVDSSS